MSAGLILLLVMSTAALGAYGHVFLNRARAWRRFRGSRSRRELLVALALLIAATSTFIGVIASAVDPSQPLRGWSGALAVGSFTAAGIVWAMEDEES
jgi:hypothetical protein